MSSSVQGIAPVVIRQVLQSDELQGMQLSGHRIASVCLVAIVRRCERSPTKLTLLLEDHTGQITAHFWLEDLSSGGGGSNNHTAPTLNAYSRVYGAIRHLLGVKSIMVYHMEPVQSPNCLTNHLLEMLYARFKAEKCAIECGDQNAATSGGLNLKQSMIYDAIKRHEGTDEGISRQELHKMCPHVAGDELNQITDWMMSEGHIYTSIDSEHFLTT